MSMSEKVGRLGRGYGRENLGESNFLPDNFFHDEKREVTSSVTRSKRFECFSSFLKYLFVINWQVFAVFLNNSQRSFKASQNSLLFRLKHKSWIGSTVSHADEPFSIARSNARLVFCVAISLIRFRSLSSSSCDLLLHTACCADFMTESSVAGVTEIRFVERGVLLL